MAYSVRITGYGGFSKKPVLELEPPWWDVNILVKDPRFRESVDLGSYRDYDADFRSMRRG